MRKKALLICIDGCGPDYLNEASFIESLGDNGYFVEGDSIVPSVTNVNNVSILTGKYPEVHGVTSNYYYSRTTGKEVYMESSKFIRVKTLLEWGTEVGLKTALLTSKDKLRSLIGKGANVCFSAEKPPAWIVKRIGNPPSTYSVDVNFWLFKAAQEVVLKEDPDLTYVTTTDYAMHKYAPQESESKRHIRGIDQSIQELIETFEAKGKNALVCVTADHGMSEASTAINLELTLKDYEISSKMNTIIADRYVVHHSNLGGAAYIYLENVKDLAKSVEMLRDTQGVEIVLTRKQASNLYHLDIDRIGDILVLGKKGSVFGLLNQQVSDVHLRSHGSLHEMKVPIIVNLSRSELNQLPQENKDLAPLVVDWFSNESRDKSKST